MSHVDIWVVEIFALSQWAWHLKVSFLAAEPVSNIWILISMETYMSQTGPTEKQVSLKVGVSSTFAPLWLAGKVETSA